MRNLIALLHYFGVVLSDDPDWMNDWLSHMDADIAELAQAIGHFLASWGGYQ